jgi:DNA-binding PadR family transcriptional regulator
MMEHDRNVLAAIRNGAEHGYDIFLKTRLAIQDTASTLARLERAGLITGTPEGGSSRTRYSLTTAGLAALETVPPSNGE